MPQESNEQFQQFFLQLQACHRHRKYCDPLLGSTFRVLLLCCVLCDCQLLVSTAMRVRSGLEDGAPEKASA